MIFNHYSNAANSLHFKLFTLESQTRWKIGLQENCYFSFLKATLDDAAFETWKLMNEIHSFQSCSCKGRPFLFCLTLRSWMHVELDDMNFTNYFLCVLVTFYQLESWRRSERGNGCHLKWHFNTKTKLPNLFTWFDFPLFLFLTMTNATFLKRISKSRN